MIIDIHVVVEANTVIILNENLLIQKLDIYILCIILIKEYKNKRIPHAYCHQISFQFQNTTFENDV